MNELKRIHDKKYKNILLDIFDTVVYRNVETNIPLKDYEITTESDNGAFRIDKTVSGQYLITGVNVVYNNKQWDYTLTLVKPAISRVSILK